MKKEKVVVRSLRRKIFNGVIAFFAGLIILLTILICFTQTFTFRDLLRKKIISAFNESSEAKLNIDKIEGTLFTTLTVTNLSIVVENDTLLAAKKVKLFISPLQILLNKIFIRDFEAENVKFAVLQNSSGDWNISKLLKPKDTTSTESIINSFQVNKFNIKNLHVIHKTYPYYSVNTSYDLINFDDLDIKDINISGSVAGDIKNKEFALKLTNFSLHPNLNRFTVKKFSGDFFVNTKYGAVKNFRIETDSSEINLTARLDGMNIFKKITLEDFKNYPAQVQLDVKSFWFDDLSSFINATEILKGRPSVKLSAEGKFGDIDIKELKVKFKNTSMEVMGSLKKLNTPSDMYINAKILNAHVVYNDVVQLLPLFKLPDFPGLIIDDFEASFIGEPTKFNSKIYAKIGSGKINGDAYLNVKSLPMEYKARIETDNLNLKPIIGHDSELNSLSTIEGKDVDPGKLTAQFSSQISNSKILNNVIHDFKITAKGGGGNIAVDFTTAINNLKGNISGILDFTNEDIPKYNFGGKFFSLNLYQFTADSTLDSKIGFGIYAQGERFNFDNMLTDITLNLDSSSFHNRGIPSSQLRLLVDTESETKKINLISPFVDLNFTGKFSLDKAIQLIKYEFSTIKDIIGKKVTNLNPLNVVQDSQQAVQKIDTIPAIIGYKLNVDYDFTFKDLNAFANLFNADRIELIGKGNGKIQNDTANFSVSTNLQVDSFVKTGSKYVPVFVSDLNTGIKFSRNNNNLSFDDLFGSISITAGRVFIKKEISNLDADFTFNQSKLFFNTSAVVDSLWKTELEGKALYSSSTQEFTFDRVLINNQGIEWKNLQPFYLSFAKDHFQLNGLLLKNKDSEISATGQIFNVGFVNGDIHITKLSIDEVNRMFPDLKIPLFGNVNIDAKIEGKLSAPVITSSASVKNIAINDKKVGNLYCKVNYLNKNLMTDIVLSDSLKSPKIPLLTITGKVPYDLSFIDVENRLVENQEVDLLFKTNNFELSNLGDVLPLIVNQDGLLQSNIKITGNFSKLDYSGFMKVQNGVFTGRMNNLTYNCGMLVNFDGSNIKIDSLLVKNTPDSKFIGTLNGTGKVEFDGLKLDKINLTMNGDIAIYSEKSKSVNPSFYGDLLVGSDGDWLFEYSKGKSFFSGKVLLKETNLIYTIGKDPGTITNSSNINIIYITDTRKQAKKESDFNNVVASENADKKETAPVKFKFDYNISVNTVNDANIVFIFSNLANRQLTVHSSGSLNFRSDTGPQGRLDLLPGSNLDFIRRFEATGSVLFENDITNPNLNITATYKSNYTTQSDQLQTVGVVLELNGNLDQLATNLSRKDGKFQIYTIQDMQAKQILRKTDDDAISFILTGKFKDDLTQGEKTSLASTLGNSVANSLLGSFITGFLNSTLGDIVRDVKIETDRLSLEGYILPNLKYELGGSSQALQDFRYMTLKLEYPILTNVSLRYERKDPILMNTLLEKKIDELGLKLRFVF